MLQLVFVDKYTITLNEFGTDEVQPFDLSWAAYTELMNYTFNASHEFLRCHYIWSYDGIKRCNTIIDMPETAPVSGNDRKLMIAQAKFLRSIFYFDLVASYGGVPMWTSASVDKSQIHKPRETADKVYELIVNDMAEAAEALPEKWDAQADKGRATKYAAYALLGRFYLQWGKSQEALDALNKVIGKYSLYGSYAEIFDPANKNQEVENIFEVQFSHSGKWGLEGSIQSSYWGPRGGGGPTAGAFGWGGFGPTQYLYDSYDSNDKRRTAFFATEYKGIKQTPPCIMKYRDPNYGNEIEDRIYTNSDYDYNIIIEDRIQQVASEITRYLKSTDRMAKTIVFCATEDAAERMRQALVNLNSDMVKENPDYVVRITGSDDYGKKKLDYFISVSAPYPVIATTSKLLSTGADCKMTKLIVLDEMIGSMTEFKQIIGRGTRLREKEGKTHFVVMDFRNVSRLFADPDWDGPIVIDPGFTPGGHTPPPGGDDPIDPPTPPTPPNVKPVVGRDGCKVEIIHKTVSVYDSNGKLLRQESIVDYTKENIRGEYASLDNFIRKWSKEEKKEKIREMLLERGIDLELMKADQNMADVDDFDFICHVAFDKKPLTRKERANNVKKRDFLSKYSGVAREVLEALLDKYMNTGIYEIEKTEILKLDPFLKLGKPAKIAGYFGGKAGYMQAVKELEEAIYADEAV